jgi:hypothetical protein
MVSSKRTWRLSTSRLKKGLDPSSDIVETRTRNKVKHRQDKICWIAVIDGKLTVPMSTNVTKRKEGRGEFERSTEKTGADALCALTNMRSMVDPVVALFETWVKSEENKEPSNITTRSLHN